MNLATLALDAPAVTDTALHPLSHLQALEAESIHIIREAVAESENPVLLYSIGKDSSVLLHLALKAFHPAKPPFPLLHVNTTWKFRDMIAFRDRRASELGVRLIGHVNQEGLARGIDPISHPDLHTDVMKTQGLRQALDHYGFDATLGGARRDEERSRAKERVVSLRNANTAGIRGASVPNPGGSTTGASARARVCGCFRCPIGPSSMCGSKSIRNASRWCRCISRRPGPWFAAAAL